MEETVLLYTVTEEQEGAERTAPSVYLVKKPYDQKQAQAWLDEAKKYVILYVTYSYYESYYDDEEETLAEIEPKQLVIKDGKLYAIVIHCTYDLGDYKDLLYFEKADTYAQVTIKSDSKKHGDTESESGCYARLLTREGAEKRKK